MKEEQNKQDGRKTHISPVNKASEGCTGRTYGKFNRPTRTDRRMGIPMYQICCELKPMRDHAFALLILAVRLRFRVYIVTNIDVS